MPRLGRAPRVSSKWRALSESPSSKIGNQLIPLALRGAVELVNFGVQFIIGRYASISRVVACGFADAFCEPFPICARWRPPDSSKPIDAGIVKNAPNVGDYDGFS